jgi:hypothetical protein
MVDKGPLDPKVINTPRISTEERFIVLGSTNNPE